MRRLLLTKPHQWDGKLSVSQSVCDSDFFVSYQATWGAMPVEPTTVMISTCSSYLPNMKAEPVFALMRCVGLCVPYYVV